MAKLVACVPVMTVSHIAEATLAYEKLGFAAEFQVGDPPFYAGIQRDGIGIHLQQDDGSGRVGQGSCYMIVDDVNDLWSQVEGSGLQIVEPIGDRSYGMRDFYVKDTDGNTIGFGTLVEG